MSGSDQFAVPVLDHEGVPITDLTTDDERYRVAVAAARRNGLDPATLTRAELEFLMPPPAHQKIADITDDEARARATAAFMVVKPSPLAVPDFLEKTGVRPVSSRDDELRAAIEHLTAHEQEFRSKVERGLIPLRDG